MNVTVKISVSDEGKPDYVNEVYVSDAARSAVLFDFNPSTNADVTDIKALCAALIELMRGVQTGGGAKGRCASIAITDIEKMQMMAVKALFAK